MSQSNIFKNSHFTLKTWLTQLFIQFMINESQSKSEVAKVLYISSFLKESALKWMQSKLDDYATNFYLNKQEKTQ